MKTIKVNEASGVVLDYLVSKSDNPPGRCGWGWFERDAQGFLFDPLNEVRYSPSTDWAQGGSIFSEAKISASVDDSGVWLAWCQYNYADEKRFMQSGHTELVAKARCYVAMSLGLAVEVPEDL